MATEPEQEYVCGVCRDPVQPAMSADCNWCSGRFHLNQRNDVEAKDCGQVWIDEQYMALQFACDSCLRAEDAASPERREPERLREIEVRPKREHVQVRRHYKRRD